MAKPGPPMDGANLHIGDFSWGVCGAAAVSLEHLTVAGMGLAFGRQGHERGRCHSIAKGIVAGRVARSDQSLRAEKLPVIFCLETTRRALDALARQHAARVFADKAAGYGIPASPLTEQILTRSPVRSTWAVRARSSGEGPASSRCRHAHVRTCASRRHALTSARTRSRPGTIPPLRPQDYAIPRGIEYWRAAIRFRPTAKAGEDGVIGATTSR
jgi:hypothetical protein